VKKNRLENFSEHNETRTIRKTCGTHAQASDAHEK